MKKNFPRLIGLTGSIASGKSTVLRAFARLGACTLSADELVRELYQTWPVQKQLTAWFGSANPQTVAQAVFKDEKSRRRLEDFLHPRVWKLARKKLAACPAAWAVFEVPLLWEAGWEQKMDVTVLISASADTLPERLKTRGISRRVYQARRNAQLPENEKINRADIVIFNHTTTQALCRKITRLYNAFENLYAK